MSMQADALILLTAIPEPQETEAAKWILEAAHILRQVAHPSFEADQRDAVLEEVAEAFSKQARDMQMSFEQRALMTVAERIRAMKRQSDTNSEPSPSTREESK